VRFSLFFRQFQPRQLRAFANSWQVALGVVFVSGVIFLILSIIGLRELIFNSVSPSMKNIVIKDPASMMKLNAHLTSPDSIVFFLGFLTIAVLHARRVHGSILWGIIAATVLTCVLNVVVPQLPPAADEVANSMLATRFELAKGLAAVPPSLGPTFFKMDLAHALTAQMLPFIFIFLFMLTFDAIGTLIGVCEQAGFMRDNELPRAKQAMVSDAIGTVAGAALGTSTVTSFVESAAGVEAGWANRFDRFGGGRAVSASPIFQPPHCDGRQLSANYCAGAGDCWSNDDAECQQDSVERLHGSDSSLPDYHWNSAIVFDRG
jgi:AGZA family xanthine/uracil permease-like MFS transporter